MLVHQGQLSDMQLFIIGTSLFLGKVSPLYVPLIWVFRIFFGCLLPLLGDIYSPASSSSVKFSLLQAMFRFDHFSSCPFPSHGSAKLYFILYTLLLWLFLLHFPSHLLSSGSPLHSPGHGEKTAFVLPHFTSSGENP